MAERFISGLIIITGLCAGGVGVLSAAGRIRSAHRAYRRTAALRAATSGGWDAWFLGGFSGVTMGTQWLAAVVVVLAWTLAGVCLIGLGIRLFAHV